MSESEGMFWGDGLSDSGRLPSGNVMYTMSLYPDLGPERMFVFAVALRTCVSGWLSGKNRRNIPGKLDTSDLIDDAGDAFVMLRPGLQLGDDFQVLPKEAYDLVKEWYGVARTSPVIIRYAHAVSDENPLDVQWELNPPIFSFLKVVGTHTLQVQKDSDLSPPRMVSSVHPLKIGFILVAMHALCRPTSRRGRMHRRPTCLVRVDWR